MAQENRLPCSVWIVFDGRGGPPKVQVEADIKGTKLRFELDVLSAKMPSGEVIPMGVTATAVEELSKAADLTAQDDGWR